MANDYERRLGRVVDDIHDNPAGDLSLDRPTDVAALSRFHFHRTCLAVTGETADQHRAPDAAAPRCRGTGSER